MLSSITIPPAMINDPHSLEPYLFARRNDEPASISAGPPLIERNSRIIDDGSMSYEGLFKKFSIPTTWAENKTNIAKLAAAIHCSTATFFVGLLQ